MSAATIRPNTSEWLEARRKGIGASEIAVVLGISPWESPFSLYWRKANAWEFQPSAEMEWGTRLEDAIAAKYADNHPGVYVGTSGALAGGIQVGGLVHRDGWMLATPDRFLADGCTHHSYPCFDCMGTGQTSPIQGVLELKTAHSADGWGEAGTADIPVYYRAQVQWQMAVVGVPWASVAVLIGGSDYREYEIPRDDKDIAVMVEAGRRFMARLEAGDPPPIDAHHATVTTLKRLHPDLDDVTVEVPQKVGTGWLRAIDMERKAKALKTKYEALMRAEMGSAKKATVGGSFVASHTITDVAERTQTVAAHRRDYLNAPREKKS